MRKSIAGKVLRNELVTDCKRLYMFGKPHLKIVIAAIICTVIYTTLTGGQLALIKPVIDKLIRGEVDCAIHPVKGFEDELVEAHDLKINPIKKLKKEAKSRFEKLVIVQFVKSFINKAKDSFFTIGILAMSLAPFIFISFYSQRYFTSRVVWGISRDIRNRVCEYLLPQSLQFFENKKSGELISRITNDISSTQGAVKILFGQVMLLPMKIACGLGLAFYFNWKLTLISLIGLPLIAIPVIIFGKKIKKHSKGSLKQLADLTDIMREMFSGIRIVKAYSMEKEETREIHLINRKFFKKRMKSNMARATSNGITEFIFSIGLGLVIIIGGYVVTAQKITPGELGGFITAISLMVFGSIKQLSKSYNTLQDSLAGARRVFELLDDEVKDKDSENALDLTGINGGIRFENITFGYNNENVLHNINMDISEGSVVGIVGQSGAGKSTILNLILRFYTPVSGKIVIGGIDIALLRHKSLLDNIALVTQQTFLFNRSIRENIMYGSMDSNQNEIEEAAKAANVHHFVETMPKGYDTIVGEMGVKLSGGQRQRIAIARAFLKNAPILILDEATSSLDSKAEQVVQDALNKLMKGKTTLVVAHRLTTIKNCDKIVVMKEGSIVETGTHDELICKQGEYSMLYRMQSY